MISHTKINLIALAMLMFSNASYADDLEILAPPPLVDANILFVTDLSGSMNLVVEGGTETRKEVLSGALQNIIQEKDFEAINFGLSVFSGNAQKAKGADLAKGILYPVSPIIGTPAQNILNKAGQNILNKAGFTHPDNSFMPAAGTNDSRGYLGLLTSDPDIFDAGGDTPLVDAFFEAATYFRGEDVLAGRHTADDIRAAHPSTYDGVLTNVFTVTPATTEYKKRTRNNNNEGINCSTDLITNNRCSTLKEDSCGLATNCITEDIRPGNKVCAKGITTVAECQRLNPNWHSFSTTEETKCSTNEFEETVCSDTTKIIAKVDRTRTSCDAVDVETQTYTCDFPITKPEITTTEVVGTAVYKSPIINECSANAIILLTDGEPTENKSANDIARMIGGGANGCNAGEDPGRCGPELAKFLKDTDHADGSGNIPALDDIQNIKTYPIALSLDVSIESDRLTKEYLDLIAFNGNGGSAIIAGNQEQLTQAFKDAINDALPPKARSFSSPSYSVDTSTLLNNGNYVYLPIFDRVTGIWPGNLKKYKLVKDAVTGANILTDANGLAALDTNNALLATAKDFWADVESTDLVQSGGVANRIDPGTRNIKTDNGTDLINLTNAVDNLLFGLSNSAGDTTYKDDLVKFIKGQNPSDDSVRNHMGDIIHSKPVQLEFAGGRKTIFVGSNEGYLHAINDYVAEDNVNNGTEAFAYMPKELLKNIRGQYEGNSSTNHIYGVDGLITTWIDERANTTNPDQIGNGIVDVVNGEKAYVFFGLRRGGGTYTALEVTNPDAPVLKWSESFGTGDSWSQPVVANLKWGTTINNTIEAPVIVIGGGFNDDTTGAELAGGNNVHVINALTGAIVWDTTDAFGNSDAAGDSLVSNFNGNALPNAVPARIRVIDVDKNGSIDRLYFGDTGGNIWRVDLNAANFDTIATNNNDVSKATLHRFAALGGTGVNNRKFFEEPDVAIFKNDGNLVASVAIGSGDRPNPLGATVQDKFFVLYDKEVLGLPTAIAVTADSTNLKAVPVSLSESSDANYQGWQKSLDSGSGEKILSSSLTFQGKVLFTSFGTSSITQDACSPSNTNFNKLHVIDLFAGTVDGEFTQPGREIFTVPKIVYPPGEICEVGNCKRTPKISFGRILEDFPTEKAADGSELTDSSGNVIPGGGKAIERVYWINSQK